MGAAVSLPPASLEGCGLTDGAAEKAEQGASASARDGNDGSTCGAWCRAEIDASALLILLLLTP